LLRVWLRFWLCHKNRKGQEVQMSDYDEKLR